MPVQMDDRRVFERWTARFPAKFKDSREDYGSNVFLRDLSAEGARIAVREAFYPNDKVDLLVELPDKHEPVNLSGYVSWIHETNPARWDVGLRFEKIDLMATQRVYKFCR